MTWAWIGGRRETQAVDTVGIIRQAASRFTFHRLGAYLEVTLAKLAVATDESHFDCVHRSIDAASRRIEQTIRRRELTPGQLSSRSRAVRAWLAFFSSRENIDLYVAARRMLSPALDEAAQTEYPTPVEIHFRPLEVMFRLRPLGGHRTVLYVPTPMVAMHQNGFAALVDQIFRPNGRSRQTLHEQLLSSACQAVQAELELLGGAVESSQGLCRDLDDAFARINTDYFAGQMPRPKLCWSGVFTGRKFGHYDATRDLVMISRTLDQATIQPFVLDFVLYHELLHKKHGVFWSNGRRLVHTAAFAQEERLFARFSEAESELQRLTRAHRDRRLCPAAPSA
jgi:hypothetical protein